MVETAFIHIQKFAGGLLLARSTYRTRRRRSRLTWRWPVEQGASRAGRRVRGENKASPREGTRLRPRARALGRVHSAALGSRLRSTAAGWTALICDSAAPCWTPAHGFLPTLCLPWADIGWPCSSGSGHWHVHFITVPQARTAQSTYSPEQARAYRTLALPTATRTTQECVGQCKSSGMGGPVSVLRHPTGSRTFVFLAELWAGRTGASKPHFVAQR